VTVREYVTVAEIGFAPYLLNLHASLIQHAGEFHLTVACADLDLVRLVDDLQLAQVSTLDVSAPANRRGHVAAREPGCHPR
jgi:hypothetical protein